MCNFLSAILTKDWLRVELRSNRNIERKAQWKYEMNGFKEASLKEKGICREANLVAANLQVAELMPLSEKEIEMAKGFLMMCSLMERAGLRRKKTLGEKISKWLF